MYICSWREYEERINELSSGTKRHSKIWESIASDINKIDPGIAVSGTQCQSKMNSMKKMYHRKIIDHNSISGNDRKSWQYFEVYYPQCIMFIFSSFLLHINKSM